jgi:hypothetical protein
MEGFDFAIKSEIEGYNVNFVKTVLAKKITKECKKKTCSRTWKKGKLVLQPKNKKIKLKK